MCGGRNDSQRRVFVFLEYFLCLGCGEDNLILGTVFSLVIDARRAEKGLVMRVVVFGTSIFSL